MNPSEMISAKKLAKGEWWGEPWGLVQGCTRVSAGCDNCWLADINRRFKRFDGGGWGRAHVREDKLTIPLKRRKPTVYTIWSDQFHEAVPFDFIDKAFAVMALCPQHLFIVLTKRPERAAEYLNWHEFTAERALSGRVDRVDMWGHAMTEFDGKPGRPRFIFNPLPNLWLYTSAENQEQFDLRVPHLLRCPAVVRGVSLSPLLGPMDISLIGARAYSAYPLAALDHVIIECESGPNRRPCKDEWVKDIIEQCDAAGVPVWVKQMSINGNVSHDPTEWPEWARRREWPAAKPADEAPRLVAIQGPQR